MAGIGLQRVLLVLGFLLCCRRSEGTAQGGFFTSLPPIIAAGFELLAATHSPRGTGINYNTTWWDIFNALTDSNATVSLAVDLMPRAIGVAATAVDFATATQNQTIPTLLSLWGRYAHNATDPSTRAKIQARFNHTLAAQNASFQSHSSRFRAAVEAALLKIQVPYAWSLVQGRCDQLPGEAYLDAEIDAEEAFLSENCCSRPPPLPKVCKTVRQELADNKDRLRARLLCTAFSNTTMYLSKGFESAFWFMVQVRRQAAGVADGMGDVEHKMFLAPIDSILCEVMLQAALARCPFLIDLAVTLVRNLRGY